MTDKEKLEKVRAEIEKRYNYHKDHADDYAGTDHFWKANEDRELLSFIDSMQEEAKYKVGDTLINSDGDKRTIAEVGEDYYKFDDCSILHFKAQDKWKLVKVPKECMYSKDKYTDDDRKVLCDGCEEECRFNKKEEPVSEEQVKESAKIQHDNETCKENGNSLTQEPISKIIFDGNFNKSWYAHPELAFKAGMQEMREQMMKDSVLCGVDGWFINNKRNCRKNGRFYKYYESTITHDKPLPMENSKDYRLIIIKED